jgi:hypothetical protein
LIGSGDLIAIKASLPTRRFIQLRHKERYVTQAAREMSEMIAADQAARL